MKPVTPFYLEKTYVPSRDNPPSPMRPGAEDHLKFKSLENKGTQAVYHRNHP